MFILFMLLGKSKDLFKIYKYIDNFIYYYFIVGIKIYINDYIL